MAREPRGATAGTPASRAMRDGSGVVLVAAALTALAFSVSALLERDYLAAMLLSTMGLAVLRAAVSLLRPSMGE